MQLNYNYILDSDINALAKSYNILDLPQNYKKALSTILPDSILNIDLYSKHELHGLINEILISRHNGEGALKAKLVEMFVKKNVTAAFEIKVNNSRVDFLKVNGDTVSYEIKSGIDNLNKLSKQIGDYEKVFEYNYIVIDEKHYKSAKKIVPEHYGIFIHKRNKLIEDKKAAINESLDSLIQLKLFTKKELIQTFNTSDITIIKHEFEPIQINGAFKEMLKRRYTKKWNFLKENIDQIFPVDYQYFFHHNIEPKIIYKH